MLVPISSVLNTNKNSLSSSASSCYPFPLSEHSVCSLTRSILTVFHMMLHGRRPIFSTKERDSVLLCLRNVVTYFLLTHTSFEQTGETQQCSCCWSLAKLSCCQVHVLPPVSLCLAEWLSQAQSKSSCY